MILVKLVVERKHGICILVVANGMKVILLPPHLIQEGMLDKPFVVFRMYVRSEKYTTQIESALTIVEIELFDGCPVILIFGDKTVIEPEALALCLLRIDAHYSFYCSIIPCTGITNYLYPLHIIR